MKLRHCLALCIVIFQASLVFAEDKPSVPKKAAGAKQAKKREPSPAMAKITDDPKLPRVLLIGDSISIGYTLDTRERLAGKANVHRIPTNGGPTTNGVANIDAWLGDGKWDVIHFNWGLHDLKYVDDLCEFARPQLAKIQLPANVHFSGEGSKVLAGKVAESILAALAK